MLEKPIAVSRFQRHAIIHVNCCFIVMKRTHRHNIRVVIFQKFNLLTHQRIVVEFMAWHLLIASSCDYLLQKYCFCKTHTHTNIQKILFLCSEMNSCRYIGAFLSRLCAFFIIISILSERQKKLWSPQIQADS